MRTVNSLPSLYTSYKYFRDVNHLTAKEALQRALHFLLTLKN